MPRSPLFATVLALLWPGSASDPEIHVVPDAIVDFAPPRILAPPVRWWRS